MRIKSSVAAIVLVATVAATLLAIHSRRLPPSHVSFAQSSQTVDAYDFVEITANVALPRAANPFADSDFDGSFESQDGTKHWNVQGFCDSENGSIFRIRFMPPSPGDYKYSVRYKQGWSTKSFSGTFHASDGHRRGPIRVDSKNPWHFVWEGSGEHYFFNGTTAYWLMGWNDEKVIQSSLDRLHQLKINRIRVTVAGRSNLLYGEPVITDSNWTLFLTPWPAKQPDDSYHPGFDYSRFDVAYWQKFDRALKYARDRDIIISLVWDMNDGRVHPAAFSSDERRFILYMVARFGAYSNITWDLGDDLDHYRNNFWTHLTGTWLEDLDPYHHLATSHPLNNKNQDRSSPWFGFTSFQEWSRNQHEFMLSERQEQQKTGRIIPQTNEEYGYEDHYPLWAPRPDSESADVLRRTAWDISMAGAYQTTGESARRGTNVWPDTGGGWMNGRGDDSMIMLRGYSHIVDFFTSFEWWKAEPHDDLVTLGNYCLAEPGRTYVLYLPKGGSATVRLVRSRYSVKSFDPLSGNWKDLGNIEGTAWTSSPVPSGSDYAFLLQKLD